MAETIVEQIAALKKMTVSQLRERHAEVFGEASKSRNKAWLFKRVAYRIQELEEGGISERAKKRAEELARDADLRLSPPKDAPIVVPPAMPSAPVRDPRLPPVGTDLKRAVAGKEHVVRILEKGCEHEGKQYGSLSAVAKAITGTNWNGLLFFGLIKRKETNP